MSMIRIRLNLEGPLEDRFKEVKADYGIEANTDVIRALITEKWKEINKAKLA